MEKLFEVSLALAGEQAEADQLKGQDETEQTDQESMGELLIRGRHRCRRTIHEPVVARQGRVLSEEVNEHPHVDVKRKGQHGKARQHKEQQRSQEEP